MGELPQNDSIYCISKKLTVDKTDSLSLGIAHRGGGKTMKRKKRRLGEQGVTAVEFALIAPFLFMLIFGVIEFGIVLYDKAMITNASREGARAGVVFVDNDLGGGTNYRLPTSDIISVVNNYLQSHLISLGDSSAAPAVTVTERAEPFGDALVVRVDYQYDFLVLPNFATSLVGELNLAGETIMKKEYQPGT